MLVGAVFGVAGNFALTKVYQKNMGDAAYESIIFNMMIGLFSSIFFWIVGGFSIEYTPYSVLMAFLMSLFGGIYTMIGFKLMSMGSMTVYTIFLMVGGAVVPYIYGVLFLNELLNWTKIIALLMIIVAVVINSTEKMQASNRQNLLCFALWCFC